MRPEAANMKARPAPVSEGAAASARASSPGVSAHQGVAVEATATMPVEVPLGPAFLCLLGGCLVAAAVAAVVQHGDVLRRVAAVGAAAAVAAIACANVSLVLSGDAASCFDAVGGNWLLRVAFAALPTILSLRYFRAEVRCLRRELRFRNRGPLELLFPGLAPVPLPEEGGDVR